MSKLFKLKEWLTLDEAVLHLSKVIDEPVTIADLYRFALDGHLKLSVNVVNTAVAIKGKWLKSDEIANKSELQLALSSLSRSNSTKSPARNEMFVSEDDWISWEENIEPISGLWDFTMKGEESLVIKEAYYKLTSGLNVKHIYSHGLLLQQGDTVCQLYQRLDIESSDAERIYNQIFPPKKIIISDAGEITQKEYVGTSNLQGIDHTYYMFFNKIKNEIGMYFVPSHSLDTQYFTYVIRTKEITRFIQSLEDTTHEAKPLHDKERTTLLVLLASMLNKTNFDLNERGIAGKIQRVTESNNTPVSEQTIRNILPLLRDIVELKQR